MGRVLDGPLTEEHVMDPETRTLAIKLAEHPNFQGFPPHLEVVTPERPDLRVPDLDHPEADGILNDSVESRIGGYDVFLETIPSILSPEQILRGGREGDTAELDDDVASCLGAAVAEDRLKLPGVSKSDRKALRLKIEADCLIEAGRRKEATALRAEALLVVLALAETP